MSTGEYRVGFDVGGTFDSERGYAPLPNLPQDRLRRPGRRSKRGEITRGGWGVRRFNLFTASPPALQQATESREALAAEASRERG